MQKIFLSVLASVCYAAVLFAVPAPTNVHWDNDTLKWELPELTNDSAYGGVYLYAFNEEGAQVAALGTSVRTQYDFSTYFYHGRTYYVKISTYAFPGEMISDEVTSPNYVVPGAKDTLTVPEVTLDNSGSVGWGYIGYLIVRATLQKKNGGEWTDLASRTTTNGWNRSVAFDALTTPGTYRAVAQALQGTDVVMQGISDELLIEETYTVTYNAQTLFADPEATTAPKNAKISLPDVPEQYRYQTEDNTRIFFWSTDAEGTTPWKFGEDSLTQDITLYAQWVELPAINPVWDGKVCTWTFNPPMAPAVKDRLISVLSENGSYIFGSGGTSEGNSVDLDASHSLYFPGHKYAYTITLRDYYNNEVTAQSDYMTAEGEASVLPLENMQVTDPVQGRVSWDMPYNLTFIRHCQLYKHTPEDWVLIAEIEDGSASWSNNKVEFNQVLVSEAYYHIVCRLYQAEYLIFEGEMYYGTDVATGVESIHSHGPAGSDLPQKMLRDGQLLILRDGRTYNAQGAQIK